MREVEIKAKLKDKVAVMKKLESLGCVFEKEVKQFDTVYTQKIGTVEDYHSNNAYLRLRVKNSGKVLFTVKQPQKNGLDKLEYEVEVSSRDEMEQALLLMGNKKAVTIYKTRVTCHYKNWEICIDEVENLGSFIEMEEQGESDNTEEIQEKMFTFFESIGISRGERLFKGYDVLMLEKNA